MDNNKNENEQFEKFNKKEKCYLINKEWMWVYKKNYLYDELYNYLEKEEIKQKLEIHKESKNYFNNIKVDKIYDEIRNNSDFFKKYYSIEPLSIDEKLMKLKEKKI